MIGWEPIQENIRLTNGDFIMSRTSDIGVLLPGTTAEIIWETTPSPTTWAAMIDGATVSWRIESAAVSTIPHGTPFVLWIHYPNSVTSTTDDYEWIVGRGQRQP